jgi:hypothetical protein
MEQFVLIETIVSRLKAVRGAQSLVLGGSYASGTQHPDSDIDIAIYYSEEQPLDTTQIRTIATLLNDTPDPVVTDIGGWGRWVNGGSWLTIQGQRVDFLYRDSDFVARTLDNCNNGIFEIDYLQQPPYGFYSYMYCAETQICQPLYDPDDIISQLKARVAAYPQSLKQAIIKHALWSANFSLENGYKTAKRGDVYFTTGCVTRAISMLVQVLYALNETYFLSEKNLARNVINFKVVPHDFVYRAGTILSSLGRDAEELTASIDSTRTLLQDLQLLAAY